MMENPSSYPVDERNFELEEHYRQILGLLGEDAEGTCPPEEGVPGKFMVDLKEVNRRRFLQLGVAPENIDITPECTMCQSDKYWSHRATKGVRGTQASIIML